MQVKVNIQAQVYQNYNVDANGFGETPYWKPKGGFTFQIEDVDPDDLFYTDSRVLKDVFQSLLDKESNTAERFEYVSHELVTQEPAVIAGVDFTESLNQMLNL